MSNTMEIAKVYYRNQKMIELSGRLIQNAQRQNYYNVAQNQKEMIQCFSEQKNLWHKNNNYMIKLRAYTRKWMILS